MAPRGKIGAAHGGHERCLHAVGRTSSIKPQLNRVCREPNPDLGDEMNMEEFAPVLVGGAQRLVGAIPSTCLPEHDERDMTTIARPIAKIRSIGKTATQALCVIFAASSACCGELVTGSSTRTCAIGPGGSCACEC
jgi:hypothetical protein